MNTWAVLMIGWLSLGGVAVAQSLDGEAQAFAARYFEGITSRCGGTVAIELVNLVTTRHFFQFQGMGVEIRRRGPFPLDAQHGIEWQGQAVLQWTRLRSHHGREWSPWVAWPVSRLPFVMTLKRVSGHWQVVIPVANYQAPDCASLPPG